MTDVKDSESGWKIDAAEDIGDVKNVIMAQEADVKLSGMTHVVMTLFKAIIGVGVLELPYAFKMGGWLFSIFVFPILAVLNTYCMVSLIRAKEAAHLSRTTAPADVGQASFGKAGRIVVACVLIFDTFGVCMSYFIFITYNMQLLTNVNQLIWAPIFFILFFLASFVHPLKYISVMSMVANGLLVTGVLIAFIASFAAATPSGKPQLFNWTGFPIFLGLMISAFQAIEMALPAHNMLKDQKKFTLSVCIVLTVVCLLYLIFGLGIYLRLADSCNGMITETIDVRAVQVVVAILFILALIINSIVWVYPIFEISDRLSCANKFRIISAKERARILAENEGQNVAVSQPSLAETETEKKEKAVDEEREVEMQGVSSSDSLSDNKNNSRAEMAVIVPDTKSAADTPTNSAVVPVDSQGPNEDEVKVGVVKGVLANWKYWTLSAIGRLVVLIIVMTPTLTPIRNEFSSFYGLIGSAGGILMAYILPMVAQLKLQWKTLPIWQRVINICIVVISVPALIYIAVMQVISLVDSMSK